MAKKPAHMAPEGGKHVRRTLLQDLAHTRNGRKIGARALSVVMAGTLAMAPFAVAASEITVDGTTHLAGTAVSGSGQNGGTWAWDGADDLTLDSYDGSGIYAIGDLNVELVGDNVITDHRCIEVDAPSSADPATLTVSGEGSLTLNAGFNGIDVTGDVIIDGTTVDITNTDPATGSDDAGIAAFNGDITIQNGAEVSIEMQGGKQSGLYLAWDGDHSVTITDSTVSIDNNYFDEESDYSNGIYAWGEGDKSVTIENSEVTITADQAIAFEDNGGTYSVTVDGEAQTLDTYAPTTYSAPYEVVALSSEGERVTNLQVSAPQPETPADPIDPPAAETVKPVDPQPSNKPELPKTADATSGTPLAAAAFGILSTLFGAAALRRNNG